MAGHGQMGCAAGFGRFRFPFKFPSNLLPLLLVLLLLWPTNEVCAFLLPSSAFFDPHKIGSAADRSRRFAAESTGHRWSKGGSLSWKLHGDGLAEADVYVTRNTLHRAFSLWEEAWPPLNFSEKPATVGRRSAGAADLNIHFLVGEHGDGLPFDGPEGVIAHAFYPPVGELHLDAEEPWTLNSPNGTNLYRTLAHEIGHLLGLGHSDDPQSVMFPTKRPVAESNETTTVALSREDVEMLHKLYRYEK